MTHQTSCQERAQTCERFLIDFARLQLCQAAAGYFIAQCSNLVFELSALLHDFARLLGGRQRRGIIRAFSSWLFGLGLRVA